MLSIIDDMQDQMFKHDDFQQFGVETDIVNFPENKNFNGEMIKKLSPETRYLIMNVIDKIDLEELLLLPHLEYIGITSTGWWDKYFNIKAIKEHGITTTNISGYSTHAVSEAVFGTVLSVMRKIDLQKGDGNEGLYGFELFQKNLGIIGLGEIGSCIADIGLGFGMNVLSYSKKEKKGVNRRTKEAVLSESDIITIQVPKSAGIILDNHEFGLLKKTVTIVNVCGSELLDREGLNNFLLDNPQATYIDLSSPQGELKSFLTQFPNTHIFKSFSNKTHEALQRRKTITIQNFSSFLYGGPYSSKVI